MAGSRNGKAIDRLRLNICGIVQGVGFRPFVYRTAHRLGLTGWVRNSSAGVLLEIQGSADALSAFEAELISNAPPLSSISSVKRESMSALQQESDFVILNSMQGEAAIQIAPDTAICPDCLKELLDPSDRRYLYPFINCTNCGPRYSIIRTIPYDRQNTTMAGFPQCPDCLAEYGDPENRRFHAQPNACPVCGPRMSLMDAAGNRLAEEVAVVEAGIRMLQEGKILAIKGIGGYHLTVDACNHEAVRCLRERKKRDEKPFAVMAADLESARRLADLSPMDEKLLASPESPIVIVRKSSHCPVSPLVAPNNGWLGLMLPYAPLHHLLFRDPISGTRYQENQKLIPVPDPESRIPSPESRVPVLVMTSANISDEPIVYEDHAAFERLGHIADFFLVHNRPIHTRCDDSVIRVFQGKPLFYRRARGYAPRPVRLPFRLEPILAAGAEMKGAICLASGDQAFMSQHLGDLQNSSTNESFRHCIRHMSDLLQITPESAACDLHPDYSSSLFAAESGLPLTSIQHHHAHMASCMAENGLTGDVIGIILDGTGYGSDGTIWGGEFLIGGYDGFQRAGHFRQARLPGGDAAVREPWRMALSYLYQLMGNQAFELDHPVVKRLSGTETSLLKSMLQKGLNSPLTSSCGRLFDAVAALLGVRHIVSYDGQAAIELEALAEGSDDEMVYYSLPSREGRIIIDFSWTISSILADLAADVPTAVIARRFHNSVAQAAVETCCKIAEENGLDRVVLSGGVFQNRLLSELVYNGLISKGLQVFTHRLVPPNDGGIALGQAAIAGRRIN